MFDFLVLGENCHPNRLVACVDTLGEARRLAIVDDCKMELVTDKGVWTLDRRAFEPAFDLCGLVGVGLPSLKGQMALYLDLRIVAALAKAKMRWVDGDLDRMFEKGREIPLYSEAESLEIIRREMVGDFWSLGQVASQLTWIDVCGRPIPAEGDFDINAMIALGATRNLPLGELDTRLCELCMLMKPSEDERKRGASYQYLVNRMSMFLSARYAHNLALEKYLKGREQAELGLHN